MTFQGLPRSTRFLEQVLCYLPDWRKCVAQFPVVPWHHFMCHVRDSVNPLAADDHLKEVIQQLQLMGEVVYVKAELSDLVVIEPNWLTKGALTYNNVCSEDNGGRLVGEGQKQVKLSEEGCVNLRKRKEKVHRFHKCCGGHM